MLELSFRPYDEHQISTSLVSSSSNFVTSTALGHDVRRVVSSTNKTHDCNVMWSTGAACHWYKNWKQQSYHRGLRHTVQNFTWLRAIIIEKYTLFPAWMIRYYQIRNWAPHTIVIKFGQQKTHTMLLPPFNQAQGRRQ